MVKVVNR